ADRAALIDVNVLADGVERVLAVSGHRPGEFAGVVDADVVGAAQIIRAGVARTESADVMPEKAARNHRHRNVVVKMNLRMAMGEQRSEIRGINVRTAQIHTGRWIAVPAIRFVPNFPIFDATLPVRGHAREGIAETVDVSVVA